MNLKQALKLKNSLIQDINELMTLIQENNAIIEGNIRIYNLSELIFELDSKILELTILKSNIQKANLPIYDKIFTLSELKFKIAGFKQIPTNQGIQKASYGSPEGEILNVELNQKEVRNLIKELEKKVINIQEELDIFNSVTEI